MISKKIKREFKQEWGWGLSNQLPQTVCYYATRIKGVKYLPFVWRGYDIKICNLDKNYHENEIQR